MKRGDAGRVGSPAARSRWVDLYRSSRSGRSGPGCLQPAALRRDPSTGASASVGVCHPGDRQGDAPPCGDGEPGASNGRSRNPCERSGHPQCVVDPLSPSKKRKSLPNRSVFNTVISTFGGNRSKRILFFATTSRKRSAVFSINTNFSKLRRRFSPRARLKGRATFSFPAA